MICIPITGYSEEEAMLQIEMSLSRAHLLELRMDLINGDLRTLMERCRSSRRPVKILVTNRRRESSASGDMPGEGERIAVLKEAVHLGADYVDVELYTPEALRKDVLAAASTHDNRTRVIISHHDFSKTPSLKTLKSIFHDCVECGASVAKIVTLAKSPEDNLTVLSLIPYARDRKNDIIAFCMGEQGRESRIMAPLLGSYFSFASLKDGLASAPGQLTVSEMEDVLNLAGRDVHRDGKLSMPPDARIFGLLGNPVKQSLSPLMHEAALMKMKIAAKYLPFSVQDIGSAVKGMRAIGICGVSVTVPFKVAVMKHLDEVDADARKIGAVNTIVNHNGRLEGFNTDWIGLVRSIGEITDIKGKVFTILGAGGTARAAVFGIDRKGGVPVIVNRNVARGEKLAKEWGCSFYPLSELGRVRADCLINTTPVGMIPNVNESPVSGAILVHYRWVVDVVYNPLKTRLIRDAEKAACITVPGLDMFVHQGAEQIRLWTGQEAPREFMKQVVRERLLYGN
ncbi:MAG: shikimate dehydrogenase [Syntrophales bacterium]|jgi:3-dehydroquinate dehydratase / shikimate dehydrogenase